MNENIRVIIKKKKKMKKKPSTNSTKFVYWGSLLNTARVFVFGTTSNGIAEGGNSLSTEKKKKNGKKEKGRVRSHEDCSHAQQRRKMWKKKWNVGLFTFSFLFVWMWIDAASDGRKKAGFCCPIF